MTTVWEETQPKQAQTHFFIVGVGAYRHLRGGSGTRAAIDLGLKSLTSPPISARAFATWVLKNFNNPDAPLGTVELLLSEATKVPYELPNGGQIEVEAATIGNIQAAFDRWYDRCDENQNNTAIFYFCGHGVVVQGDRLLLAEDFGENKQRPFHNTINFDNTFLGMTQCKASLQCYFVDACRQVPWQGLEYQTASGVTLVAPKLRGFGSRDALILNASAPDDKAYGKPNDISRFTKALLDGLNGGGSKRKKGKWLVTTQRLGEAVCDLVNWRNRHEGGAVQQSSAGGETTSSRPIHILDTPPIVPVIITLTPSDAEKEAELMIESIRHPEWRHRHRPPNSTWEPDKIKADIYKLNAHFPSGRFKDIMNEILEVNPPILEEEYKLEANS